MSETPHPALDGRSENEVWGAIAAFEQILEAVPDDTGALDALAQAYELVGERERARNHLIRLARVYLQQGNTEAAAELVDRLARYGRDDLECASLIDEIQSRAGTGRSKPRPPPPSAPAEPRKGVVDAELALAWKIRAAGLISADLYTQVVNDLADIAARTEPLPISVLHVLQDRGFPEVDKVLAWMARESRTPVVPVTSFESPDSCYTALPLDFMIRRAAIPFEVMAQEFLVAVMNPFDDALREQVREKTVRPCHFYLTWPTEFDAWIERCKQYLERHADKPPS